MFSGDNEPERPGTDSGHKMCRSEVVLVYGIRLKHADYGEVRVMNSGTFFLRSTPRKILLQIAMGYMPPRQEAGRFFSKEKKISTYWHLKAPAQESSKGNSSITVGLDVLNPDWSRRTREFREGDCQGKKWSKKINCYNNRVKRLIDSVWKK